MIYEDFVRTLLARMGLPYEKADAGAARDGVDRLVRLSAMVDDLLAEAGYDTLFDTREKCLEALRQDIKAKLGTASVDRETLARNLLADEVLRLRTELADAQRQVEVWRDTAETQKKMRLDLAAEQDKLVAALDEAQNQLAAERKKWPELKAEVERLKKIVRIHALTISLFGNIVHGHAAPTATQKCADTGLESHIAPDVREALGRLIERAKASERLREANRELADAIVARKPLDRDRIRLALLDFSPTVNFINDLADHLVKRLA